MPCLLQQRMPPDCMLFVMWCDFPADMRETAVGSFTRSLLCTWQKKNDNHERGKTRAWTHGCWELVDGIDSPCAPLNGCSEPGNFHNSELKKCRCCCSASEISSFVLLCLWDLGLIQISDFTYFSSVFTAFYFLNFNFQICVNSAFWKGRQTCQSIQKAKVVYLTFH